MSTMKNLGPSRLPMHQGLVFLIGAVLGGGIGFYLGWVSSGEQPPAAEQQQPPLGQQARLPGSNAAMPASADAQQAEKAQESVAIGDSGQSPSSTPPSPSQPAPAPEPIENLVKPGVEIKSLSLPIRGSLAATLSRNIKGHEADILTAHVGRLLVWWLDTRRDVLRGDHIQVVYHLTDDLAQMRILALSYKSVKNGKTHHAFYYKPKQVTYGRYYDEDGVEIESRLLQGPLEEYEQVTELMNLGGRRHHGVDFKTEVGTSVRVPKKAKVLRRNWNTRNNGHCLSLLYLSSGVNALFLHLDKVLPIAKVGAILEPGVIVAHTGNTGRSTAPHLHYELHSKKGRLINPFDFHKTFRKKLDAAEMGSFQKQRDQLERLLEKAGT